MQENAEDAAHIGLSCIIEEKKSDQGKGWMRHPWRRER